MKIDKECSLLYQRIMTDFIISEPNFSLRTVRITVRRIKMSFFSEGDLRVTNKVPDCKWMRSVSRVMRSPRASCHTSAMRVSKT